MRVRTQCRACGLPFGATLEPGKTGIACPACEQSIDTFDTLDPEAPTTISTCALCESPHLYRQKDVNRALGCLLVFIGAVFVPWTYGLSLALLTLVDVVLYMKLPEAVVCYRCDTVFRDARPTPGQQPIDLLKHDVVKYGKTWQEADLPGRTAPEPVTESPRFWDRLRSWFG